MFSMTRYYLSNQLLFFCLISVVEAYKIFETKCSKPISPVNFVWSPDSRGTLDILWSSLFTIIACTWTIQHPNIPELRNGRDPGWKGDLKWQLKGFYQSTKWMLYTMIAPEIIIGTACDDLVAAYDSCRILRNFASQDNISWTLTHSYYANMGGFVIRSRVSEDAGTGPYIKMANMRVEDTLDTDNTSGYNPGVSQNDGNRTQWNPEQAATKAAQKLQNLAYHDPYHLTAYQIQKLRHKNIIPKLPLITKEEIDDKSKSDSFIKTVAIVQILWTTLQIIVRASRKLTISQLELAALAFAACAVVIYILYWRKPKCVGSTTAILQYQGQMPSAVLEQIKEVTYLSSLYFFLGAFMPSQAERRGSRVINGAISSLEDDSAYPFLAIILGAMLFGGIHVGAWNFHFPSNTELILWRCASAYSAAAGPCTLLVVIVGSAFDMSDSAFGIIVGIFGFLYIIARLFLLVEIFRTLCFLPPDAFVATWTSNMPHVT